MGQSEFERMTILMIHGYSKRVCLCKEVTNLLNDSFPDRPPVSKYIVLRKMKGLRKLAWLRAKSG